MSSFPPKLRVTSGALLARSTLIAALFVAVQTWYALVQFVEASETRLMEKKLDLCFENFDAAAVLDAALRSASNDMGIEYTRPTRIQIETASQMRQFQTEVVPKLNTLESGLAEASILGDSDKYGAYLAQQLTGLSKRFLDIVPAQVGTDKMADDITSVFKTLSEFLGSQYLVFTGCRMVAEETA